MNSKYTNKNGEKKLLAAVMAFVMVFAIGIIIADGSESDAAIVAYTADADKGVQIIDESVSIESGQNYYASSSMEITIGANITTETIIFVGPGATVTVSVAKNVDINTSVGTLRLITASSVTEVEGAAGAPSTYKVVQANQIVKSAVSAIVDGGDKIVYSAAVLSGNSITTNAYAYGSVTGDISGNDSETKILIPATKSISGKTVTNFDNGISATSNGKVIEYPKGSIVSSISLLISDDTVTVTSGTVEVQQGSNVVKLDKITSTAGVTVTYGDVPTIKGTTATSSGESGSITVTAGAFVKAGSGLSGTAKMNYVSSTCGASTSYTAGIVDKVGGTDVSAPVVNGTITQYQNIDAALVITIADNSTLVIPEGVSIKVTSIAVAATQTLKVFGEVDGNVTGAGDVFIGPEGYVKSAPTTAKNIITGQDSGVSETLRGDETRDVLLAEGNNVVPVGETYTIYQKFGLNGNSITVNGTLIIAAGAEVFGTGSGVISLGADGKIIIEGTLAKNMPVKVTSDAVDAVSTDNYVVISGVDGVQFLMKDDILYASGNVTAIAGAIKSEVVTAGTVQISGEVTIGQGVILDTTATEATGTTIADKSTLIINGVLNGKIVGDKEVEIVVNGALKNGSTVVVKEGTSAGSDSTKVEVFYDSTPANAAKNGDLTGISVIVKKSTVSGQTIYTPYISGDLGLANGSDDITSTVVKITGKFAVAENTTLSVPADVSITYSGTSGSIILDGTITVIGDSTFTGYIGATYSVVTGTAPSTVETFYYTTIENALSNITIAKNKTVNANVTEIDFPITLNDKEILSLSESASVKADALITVKAGAKIIGPAFSGVSGKLVVEAGATVATPATYDSKYMDGTSTVYAGLAIAIKESDGSAPIQVVNSNVDGDLRIDAGKTVKVTGTLGVKGDLIIEEGATLVGGTVTVQGETEDIADVSIYGVLDVSTSTIAPTNAVITVYGTLISGSAVAGINAAQYSKDGKIYYTDIATAVASGEDVVVYGDYSELGSVTVPKDKSITVDETGTVYIAEIILSDGSSVITNGELETSITTAQASVNVSGKITITAVAAAEPNPAYSNIAAFDGSLKVISGTVSFAVSEVFNDVVSIETGAELIITGTTTVDAQTTIDIDGKLNVKGSLTATSTDLKVVGNLAVNGTVSVKSMTVLGNVNVDTGKTLSIAENVIVGSADNIGANGAIVGAIGLGTGKIIKAYAGADLSAAKVSTYEKTVFVVNGNEFITVYANGNVRVDQAIVKDDLAQIPGMVIPTETLTWVKENGTNAPADSKIGDYEVLSITLSSKEVAIIISVEPGIQLELDYRFYTATDSISLSAGTYKVAAKDLAGEKSVRIIMVVDGVETVIDNGEITIDSKMIGKKVIVQASYGTAPVGPTEPTVPSEDYIVSVSYNDGKVIVSVIALDGGYIPATDVTVTFSGIGMKTILGQTVPAPVTIPETFNVTDDNRSNVVNKTFELENIIGENLSIMGVSASIGQTNYGYMSLGYKS